MFLLDIIRIVCALLVYGRHSITMYGCTYGPIHDSIIISLTRPIMTCFFVLSGFALYYQYSSKNITESDMLLFYKNRLITILPSYYLIHVVYIIFNGASLKDWVILQPIEILGVQSIYNSLFGILHNGGTWFVSCMLVCYFVYPITQTIINHFSYTKKIILLCLIYFIIIYSDFILLRFGLASNYSNPFFRFFEFAIGIITSTLVFDNKHKIIERSKIYVLIILLGLGVYGCLIHFIFKVSIINTFIIYMTIPAICWLLVVSSIIRCDFLEKSRLLSVLSGMSYQFYLIQIFLWTLSDKILRILKVSGNSLKLFVSFFICVFLSFCIYKFYDKPIKGYIKGNNNVRK